MNTLTEKDTSTEVKYIQKMPATARVWVYQTNRELSNADRKGIQEKGEQFISGWTAHGAGLKASFDIFYNRFIVIAVDEQQALASGCSIDKSVHFIQQIEQEYALNLFDRLQVAYRSGEEIKTCTINNLREQLLTDENTTAIEQVIVFNNMVASKAEFDTQWQLPVKASWHNRYIQ